MGFDPDLGQQNKYLLGLGVETWRKETVSNTEAWIGS